MKNTSLAVEFIRRSILSACIVATLGARGADADARFWFVVNEDNDHFFKLPSEKMTVEGLTDYADFIARGKVTHVFLCVAGQRTSYDSKTWEPIWAGLNEKARNDTATWPDGTHDRWAVNCRLLKDRGIDPYAVWIARFREKGVSPWVSIRMNDVHFGSDTNYFRNTSFYKAHREWWIDPAQKNGWQSWQLDFAQKAVRDYTLAQVREIADRWDSDGLEIDWMRFGNALRYGHEREDAHFVDDVMRAVRKIADEAGARRNRRMGIAVRIPPVPEEAERLGFNVRTWIREGLVDVIVPDAFLKATPDLPVASWLALVEGTDVRIVPGTGSFPPNEIARADIVAFYQRLAESFRTQGAMGAYFFNLPYLSNRLYSTDGGGVDDLDVAARLYSEGVVPVTCPACTQGTNVWRAVASRTHVKAFADLQSSYWARGAIVDKNPFSAQFVDLSFDLDPFGRIGGYAWSVSSLSRSGQGAARRNFYNEVDYSAYYAYSLKIAEGWALGNAIAPKWVTLPGYRGDPDTICELNVSQSLDNPFVTPYYLWRWAYDGGRWSYWDVGIKRSWTFFERLTLTAMFFGEFGDARHFAAQYGPNVNTSTGNWSGGLMALNLMLRLDYAITDWMSVYAFYHQFDIVNSDARDTLDWSSAPQAKTDMPIFGVGLAFQF